MSDICHDKPQRVACRSSHGGRHTGHPWHPGSRARLQFSSSAALTAPDAHSRLGLKLGLNVR